MPELQSMTRFLKKIEIKKDKNGVPMYLFKNGIAPFIALFSLLPVTAIKLLSFSNSLKNSFISSGL